MKNKIYLDGLWELRLDPEKKGIQEEYYKDDFEGTDNHDSIMLPATLSQAEKGVKNHDKKEDSLTLKYTFSGYAWFQRKVVLRASDIKNVRLFLERTRCTMLWINGIKAEAGHNSLSTPHIYEIGSLLKANENTITILVDNTNYPVNGGNLVSYDAQTNWNGITGEIFLSLYRSCFIDNVRTFPDIKNKSVTVKFRLHGTSTITLTASAACGSDKCREQLFTVNADLDGNAEFTYILSDNIHTWSEYTPEFYTMKIALDGGETETVIFGIREIKTDGKIIRINGNEVFLRGKNERLVFPLSGTAPVNTDTWKDIFKTAKDYGINYYRFEGCCPPEAAFTAADMLGVYIEPELPVLPSGEEADEDMRQYLLEEGIRIIDVFGNHPSFCMLSTGGTGQGTAARLIEKYREHDTRFLYASSYPLAGADLLHIGENGTEYDVPVICSDTEINPFYPDFNETELYSDILKPENLKFIKERMTEKGIFEKRHKYFKASGYNSAYFCKTMIENTVGNKSCAGMLLGCLQDYSVPGIPFTGVLNVFMRSKGFIASENWRGFCSDKILLAGFESHVIGGCEFSAEISARCSRPEGFADDYIHWEISSQGQALDGGSIPVTENKSGYFTIGTVKSTLPKFDFPVKLTLILAAKGTENSYDLWVMPDNDNTDFTSDTPGLVTTDNVEKAIEGVRNGSPVLLISDNLKNGIPETCCCTLKKDLPVSDSTMGLIINSGHESLSLFPCNSYITPQWHNIIKDGVYAVLDDTPDGYKPIVGAVDNYKRCHKLGMLFSARVSEGRLMICTMSEKKLRSTPEGKWFIRSVRRYCGSEYFDPSFTLDENYIKSLFV